MKIKKIIAICTTGLLLLTGSILQPVSVRSEDMTQDSDSETELETYTEGIFTYAYVDGGLALYSCDTGTLAINLPDETNGKRIVAILDGAFYNCTKLEYAEIGKYVKTIGESAFQNCSSLKGVSIPDSVETISRYAFAGCTSLKTLNLPKNLKEIPEGLCYECYSLENLELPDTLETIGSSAFYNCNLFNYSALPENLQSIGDYAFAFCYAVENADLPSSLTSIGSAAYYGCVNITEFTVPKQLENLGTLTFLGCVNLTEYAVQDGNPTYTVQDGVLYKDNAETLYAYPCGKSDTSFIVPEGVVTIYDAAFFSAPNLQEVTFPSTLKYIGAGAFEYCTDLKQIDLPEGVEILYENAFADCTALTSVHLPETLRGMGNYVFYACDSLKELTIPKNCKTVGEYAVGYTDGEETDENGNPVPVKIAGFKKHTSVNITAILLVIAGVAILATIIAVLMKLIRKTQMTSEEHEAIEEADLKAEDAQYVKILEEIEKDSGEPENKS